MKYIQFLLISACCSLILLLPTACKKPCDKADCGTYGNCREVDDEAVCTCDVGWEKNSSELCEIRSTDKFSGTWAVAASCTDQVSFDRESLTYTVDITAEDPEVNVRRIYIQGLGDLPECLDGSPIDQVLADVSINSITIGALTYCANQAKQFSGFKFSASNGSINTAHDEISLDYRVAWTKLNDSGELESVDWLCESTWTKP
ncbi:MAG: hypothetical protein AAF587_06435 [Bacteroidota bacterium]